MTSWLMPVVVLGRDDDRLDADGRERPRRRRDTWVLPSGRRYPSWPVRRTWASRMLRRCASQIGSGSRSSVSSQA